MTPVGASRREKRGKGARAKESSETIRGWEEVPHREDEAQPTRRGQAPPRRWRVARSSGGALLTVRTEPRRTDHARGVDDGRSHIASLREDTLARCRPLTPDDLTAAERLEAETLADDLIQAGGLGHFVIGLMHTWNDLSERGRLQAAWCWDTAVAQVNVAAAA